MNNNPLGNVVDLLQSDLKSPLIIQEGESANITGQLVDTDGTGILVGNITTFVLTLYRESDLSLVNAVNEADILNVGRGTVDANGNFIIRLDGLDTTVLDATLSQGTTEAHIARLKWTWNDGVASRTSYQEIRHRIQKLGTPS